MILTKELVFCWRYGQLLPKIRQFLYVGFVFFVLLPFFWFWQQDNYTVTRLVLIDVLLGLPLLVALGLTAMIIWQGIIKTIACVFGWVRFDETDSRERFDEVQ